MGGDLMSVVFKLIICNCSFAQCANAVHSSDLKVTLLVEHLTCKNTVVAAQGGFLGHVWEIIRPPVDSGELDELG